MFSPLAAAAPDAWRWQPHPEVWVMVLGVVGLGLYATRVIGPKVVADGEPVTTVRQRIFFVLGVLALWFASDWPLHDVSEEYLYSMHMVQHLVLTLVMPPLFLLATPTWLARAVIGEGALATWLRRFAKPVVAGLLFNATIALTHWPAIVNTSVENGPFHYLVHLVVVTTAFLMWMPVCGPIPEWRLSQPAQMVYLFVMSILPTVPAGWMTFADRAVYEAYDHSQRLWGVSVVDDQQMAGLVMKTAGGLYLWGVIASIFFRWAAQHERTEREEMAGRPVPSMLVDGVPEGHPESGDGGGESPLTWDDVRSELDRLGPAPHDPADH